MALFDKFAPFKAMQEQLQARDSMPFGAITEKILSPTEAIVSGNKVILAGTNNYLGLTFEPESIAAAQRAIAEQGTGTTGSRMANGTFAAHVGLEADFADFFGRRFAMLFSTGFAATSGMSASVAGPGDVILLDADCHASIYDGVRLSGAEIIRFRHNDAGDLDKRLRRLGDRSASAFVIVEGIYSMLGDIAPLADIVAVKSKYGACLMVDEAHSMGVLGDHGRGAAEAAGVEDGVDFIAGTFSKSLGSIGGYCVSDHEELDLLRFVTRSYLFTASSSPSVIASTRETLKVLRARPELRERLRRNAERLYNGLAGLGFELGPDISPIVAARTPDAEDATRWWEQLFAAGVFVNLVIPPASPSSYSLLRCSISAAHSDEQIERIIEGYAALT